MSPYDDPHVSAGEIADYLSQPLIKPFLMHTLTKPDTSTDVIRQGQVIGQIKCIDINPASMPPAIRYHGQNASGTASGQAHETQAQAAQDVANWANDKQVTYHKHAELAPNCVADCATYKAVQ